MASLFNTRISDTYSGLIKTIDNAALTSSLKELTDGTGLASGVFMNTAGDFKVTAILEFGSLKDTGENIIISKFVDAADGVLNNDNDTSMPTTAAIIDYVQGHVTLQDLDFEGDTGNGSVDLDSQLLDIAGTANEITTVALNQKLTISLNSSGVVLPNGSTATTQSAGDNSTKIATTSYVDTLDAASDLDFSGDSGTGDVNLNTQTFAITGTTNQITTAASGQGLSLSLPATVHRDLQGNVTGNVTGDLTGNVTAASVLANGVTATTQASSDDSTKVATTAYVKGLNNASDLDFTTDSGSGAVVLNSETFSVLGTTNEIETSGSGQAVTIGLPSTVNVNVTGNLTGNVTGNVTGSVTGNVTGDLTGNADTATAWETARDLSLTGQATGTISSVDGTGNVSGAVTLDNNSVTSKVLTGLTSPSASSVLATDTIVEGFGKLQSQVNGLAGGLRFMGDWNATTNSPVLSSGGGEAANGTTTSTTANKLIDSSASFTSTVTVGDQVVNQVDGQTALVSNVDSDTTLSLSADIMLTGEAYTIDNSPFITQGHYYVVSVGGTTTLNGISNWTVGDWVIAGANNQWTKLDHSQVDGTGTTGNLTKWSATQVIADSIVSESGTAITVDGSLATNSFLSSTGNFAVNTDKFTIAASSGNTAFTGDLAINTNKFTVNATSGNTLVAGDVTLPSGYLNVTTDGSVAYGLIINSADQSHSRIRINNTGSGGNAWSIMSGTSGVSNDGFAIRNETTTTTALQFTNTGAATFAGNLTVGRNIDLSSTDYSYIQGTHTGASDGEYVMRTFGYGDSTFYGSFDILRHDTDDGELRLRQRIAGTATDVLSIVDGNSTFAGDVIQSGASKSLKYWRRLWTDANNDWGLNNNAGSGVISVSGMGTPSTSITSFAGLIDAGGRIKLSGGNTDQYFVEGARNGIGVTYRVYDNANNIYNDAYSSYVVRVNQLGGSGGGFFFSGGDFNLTTTNVHINGGTNYNDKSNLNLSNGRTVIQSDIVDGTANGDTSLSFQTRKNGGTATAMFIDEFRNVGIGTDDPNSTLSLENSQSTAANNTTTGSIFEAASPNSGIFMRNRGASAGIGGSNYSTQLFTDSGAGNFEIYNIASTSDLVFGTNATEKLRIESSGRIKVPGVNYDPTSAGGNDTGGLFLVGDTLGDGNFTAGIGFAMGTGTATISGYQNGTDSDRIGLSFHTHGSGTGSAAANESMRITSGGDFIFNTGSTSTQTYPTQGSNQVHASGSTYFSIGHITGSSSGNLYIGFGYNGGAIGSITQNGTTGVAYNTSSDYRLKEDLQDFAGLDMVSKIPVYDFKWKTDESRSYGVMAHELQEILPLAVTGEKDAEKMQSVDYSKIVPLLVKSIQELTAKVDKLEQECKCKN